MSAHARALPSRFDLVGGPAARIAAAGIAGFAVGVLTSHGQGLLPAAVNSFANSTSGWVLPAFAVVWLLRLRPAAATIAGPIVFTAMMAGYYVATDMRGYSAGSLLADAWLWLGLAAGPVVGLGAALLRDGSPLWRALAIVPVAVVLVSDGLHGLTRIADTTSPVYWSLCLVGAVLFVVWQLVRSHASGLLAASVLLLVAGGAAVIDALYGAVFSVAPLVG